MNLIHGQTDFEKRPLKDLLDLGLPVAEIDYKGHCIITKAALLRGTVTKDVLICELLYKLQDNTTSVVMSKQTFKYLCGIEVQNQVGFKELNTAPYHYLYGSYQFTEYRFGCEGLPIAFYHKACHFL